MYNTLKREVIMKKLILTLIITLSLTNIAKAEQLVVIDSNGYVVKQIFTAPSTYTTTKTTTSSPLTVVTQSPYTQNSYYYDPNTTSNVIAAGVTTALVGSLIYNGFKHHHKHHYKHKRPKHFKPHHRPHKR